MTNKEGERESKTGDDDKDKCCHLFLLNLLPEAYFSLD